MPANPRRRAEDRLERRRQFAISIPSRKWPRCDGFLPNACLVISGKIPGQIAGCGRRNRSGPGGAICRKNSIAFIVKLNFICYFTRIISSHTSQVDAVAKLDNEFVTDREDNLLRSKILIVDDEEVNVRLLKRILQHGGFTNLSSTTDSRKAVALFQEVAPDLILTDWLMPHLDGYALIERLRQLISTSDYLPIVVLTADVTPQAKQQARPWA